MNGWSEADVIKVVERAVAGDRAALERVVTHVQSDVYDLAVRMLWCPEDAADATQEILMKLVTRLWSFRGESAFRTWVYRTAVNHLLDVRRSRVERENLTFASFGASLRDGLTDPPAGLSDDPEQRVLVEEVKIGCTLGMLICLTREERVAYILGDVFELTSVEAAEALDISQAAFRQRLARARSRLRTFVAGHCGLVNEDAACRCERRVRAAIDRGRVRPGHSLFVSTSPPSGRRLPLVSNVSAKTEEMDQLHRIAGLFRSHPRYQPPATLIAAIRAVLESGRYSIMS